jgi:hypothetical protein
MDHLQAMQTTYRTSTLGSADITSDNAQANIKSDSLHIIFWVIANFHPTNSTLHDTLDE